MMMKGSSQDWKLTTMSRYTRTIEKPRPETNPIYDARMVSKLPANRNKAPPRQKFAVLIDDLRDIPADRAQITVLHRGVNIDHAADIVVVDHLHLVRALDGGNIGKDLRAQRFCPLKEIPCRSCSDWMSYCGASATRLYSTPLRQFKKEHGRGLETATEGIQACCPPHRTRCSRLAWPWCGPHRH